MPEVWRYDNFGGLTPIEVTPEGAWLVEAIIAIPGILQYKQDDGSIVRELISEEELFNADSLLSLGLKPITAEHPDVPVDVSNMKQFRVGNILQDIVVKEGPQGFVRVKMLIDDPDAQEAARNDGMDGTSPAYKVIIVEKSGVHPIFGEYDRIQTNRRYNHTALTRNPRAGFAAHVRLDSGDAIMIHERSDTFSGPDDNSLPENVKELSEEKRKQWVAVWNSAFAKNPDDPKEKRESRAFAQANAVVFKKDGSSKPGIRMPTTINLDGITYEIEDIATAQAINQFRKDQEEEVAEMAEELKQAKELIAAHQEKIDNLDTQIVELSETRDGLQGQLDQLTAPPAPTPGEGDGEHEVGEGDEGDETNADSITPEVLQAMVQERTGLLDTASKFNMDSDESKKLSNADLRRKIVETSRGDSNKLPKDASEGYIKGCYETIEKQEARVDNSYRRAGSAITNPDMTRTDSEASALQKYTDRMNNAHKPQPAK